MKAALRQIADNLVAANTILDSNDPEQREDFYCLIEGIQMKSSEILNNK